MSEILYMWGGVAVSKYVGPELPNPADRRRYQISDMQTSRMLVLTHAQWEALGNWFCRDCSVECEGPHLDLTWDSAPQ